MQTFEPFYDAVKLCGHRWTLEILTSLRQRPMRFTDLLQMIGPSAKSLNEALRRLQDQELVCRSSGDEVALYQLTPAGRQLLPLLLSFMQEIQRWAEQHRGDSGRQATAVLPSSRRDRASGH